MFEKKPPAFPGGLPTVFFDFFVGGPGSALALAFAAASLRFLFAFWERVSGTGSLSGRESAPPEGIPQFDNPG